MPLDAGLRPVSRTPDRLPCDRWPHRAAALLWHRSDTVPISTASSPAAGDAVFFDYRVVDGHPVPQVIELMGDLGEQIIYIDEVEFGVEIADSAFRMR